MLTSAEVWALPQRSQDARLDRLIADARGAMDVARRAHLRPGQRTTARCILFSGGDDSTVLAHLFRRRATHAIHANTGIGIEDTRRFVRDTCAAWGLPLIEEFAGDFYERWVLEHGFPGPAMHHRMYTRLKERQLRKAVRRLNRILRSRENRVIFLAGRRREESTQRRTIPAHERIGSVIWVSPLVDWTKADLANYRKRFPDCPRNPVSVNLHMSGECLCGSYAHEGELDEIGFFYPSFVAYIRDLEQRALEAGVPPDRCQWGRPRPGEADNSTGAACGNCKVRTLGAA